MYPKPDVLLQITEGLGVAVYELFKMDIVPDDNKELINRLSEDMTQKLNQTMKEVFKRYLRL